MKIRAKFDQNREEAGYSFCPGKRWDNAIKKKKEMAKKEFYNSTQTNPKNKQENDQLWEKRAFGNVTLEEGGLAWEKYSPSLSLTETVDRAEKISDRTLGRQAAGSGIPPLYQCAKWLKERETIINMGGSLYYFDKYCYKALDRTKLVQLYRDRVDRNLHGAKNVKGFYELYSYLLTDSEIQMKPNPGSLSKLAILKNGVYNLKKARLEPFDPSILAFSYVDANYTEDRKCPRFERFLSDVTGNDSVLVERLWKFLGYIFTQSLEAKVFFVMGCAPNSGKSLLGKFITKLYEPQYVSSIALSDFNGEFSMGSLVGAAVNVSLDLPGSRLGASAVSRLKMLTGGDLITVNQKYMPQFQYQNRAKFIFASNHPIQLVEYDEAFWERMVFLPFDYPVSKQEQDTDLLMKLLKEKDAVVSKALEYARQLMEDHYKFPTTEEIERRIRGWRGIEIDTIQGFLAEKCLLNEAYEGERMADLYTAYEDYCTGKGEKPQNQAMVKSYLENQVGLQHKKIRLGQDKNPRSAFIGICLCEKKSKF